MGEAESDALKVDFDRALRLEFHGAKVTSDAGLLAYRELDDVFDLTAAGGGLLADARTGTNTQHTMTALLRQAVLGRLAGYEDTNDADRLRVDPAMRHVVGGRAKEKLGASTSEMGRFETEFLTLSENTAALMERTCQPSGRWMPSRSCQAATEPGLSSGDSAPCAGFETAEDGWGVASAALSCWATPPLGGMAAGFSLPQPQSIAAASASVASAIQFSGRVQFAGIRSLLKTQSRPS